MSLLNTRLQELRVNSPNLDHPTLRPSRYGALDVFMQQTSAAGSIISPDLIQRAATAVGRDVKVPVFDAETVTIGSTRSATIADSENTSQLYTVSFTTYAWGFTQVRSMFQNNEIGAQADFERKFLKYLYQVAADLETASNTALSTAKSQVFEDLLGYTNTANTIIAPLASKDEIIGDLTPLMNANDYYGAPYHIVGNTGIQARFLKMMEHRSQNDQDMTYQFLDKQFHFTNNIANSAGHGATGYVVNPGSVGMLFRHERESIAGTTTPTHEWGMDTLPLIGIPIDTYYYYSVGDQSAIAGAATADITRGVKDHYGFAIEAATVTAYNDDPSTNASPIIKFAIATS